MNSDITFITGNAGKVAELQHLLQVPIQNQKIDLPELQSLDLKEISTFKAQQAYKQIGQPVLVEDVGLVFHALNRLPGPFIKWFLKELDCEGICRMMRSYEDKRATAMIVYTLYDGQEFQYFEGNLNGSIASEPRGDSGFGWDQVFIPDGQDKTYAEMSKEEKGLISHRSIAVKKLQTYLIGKSN